MTVVTNLGEVNFLHEHDGPIQHRDRTLPAALISYSRDKVELGLADTLARVSSYLLDFTP